MTNYHSVRLNMKSDRVHWADVLADDFEEVKEKIKHARWIEVTTNPNTEMQENLMIKTENIESVKNQGSWEE